MCTVRFFKWVWWVLPKTRLSWNMSRADGRGVYNWRYLGDTRRCEQNTTCHLLLSVAPWPVIRAAARRLVEGESSAARLAAAFTLWPADCVYHCALPGESSLILSYLITYTDLLSLLVYTNRSFLLLFLWKVLWYFERNLTWYLIVQYLN